MLKAKEVFVGRFNSVENPLLKNLSRQSQYIKAYLKGINVKSILIEENYFDRDYLAEFSSFYSVSARGYKNVCKRIHFFSSNDINREQFKSALGGKEESVKTFCNSYLGFIVIRPIPSSPFGRTVLTWYPESDENWKRVTQPSRSYECNIAGLILKVEGLAWQQQDSAVAACATIGLWTTLHSSAFDAGHSIPTTAEITTAAHKTASLGARIFPSNGLTIFQLREAIKELGLAPQVLEGDKVLNQSKLFSRKRFSGICASFIRSGYPILLSGFYLDEKGNKLPHAICVVGFRTGETKEIKAQQIFFQDESSIIFYIHDDNIGPNARFRLEEDENDIAFLQFEDPSYVDEPSEIGPIKFYPDSLIIAVHDELKLSAEKFQMIGRMKVTPISILMSNIMGTKSDPANALYVSTRFIKNSDYFGNQLSSYLDDSSILSKTRCQLFEAVSPMSLFIGVIRIALADTESSLLMDILIDTTDSERNDGVFAHVVYDKELPAILDLLEESKVRDLLASLNVEPQNYGTRVLAF